MLIHRQISRRDVLRAALVSGATLAVPSWAFAKQCRETPHQDEGPFYLNGYDRTRPVPHTNDLTAVPGATGLPEGEIMYVTGRITDEKCRPLKGAMVEVWQANAAGRYAHAVDTHDAPLDPNFTGAGRALTDDDGVYRFVTIKPGSYPWKNHYNAWRPQHIHFSLFGRAFTERLVTQMYFPGDPLLEIDPIYQSIRDEKARESLISMFDIEVTEPEWALGYRFDIVVGGRNATPLKDH